jgi:hypothetical protein
LAQAERVHSCYEAGPFGYVLHRRPVSMGVRNLVVRPRDWSTYGERVKTDDRDAGALCSCQGFLRPVTDSHSEARDMHSIRRIGSSPLTESYDIKRSRIASDFCHPTRLWSCFPTEPPELAN